MDLDGLPLDEAEFIAVVVAGYSAPYREDKDTWCDRCMKPGVAYRADHWRDHAHER